MKKGVITIENLTKTFRVPHTKITTMRGAFVNAFAKKTYEDFVALNDVSLHIEENEFFGIVGHNGSGKSTLLKILAGIYRQDKGRVRVHGRISPFLELGIGFNAELSGRDNIYLNATILGLSREQIDKRFDEIVAFAGVGRFIDQKLQNYSSGMQVRLAFSVAVHVRRPILLMDEVLAVGDARFQKKCYDYFSKIKGSKTIILVSHDLDNIRQFCDRVAVLDGGRIIAVDKPQIALEKYEKIMH